MINHRRLAEEFMNLARIASPSYREGEISDYLTRRFRELGADVVMDDAGGRIGAQSGNLLCTIPASGRDSDPFMISVHMDTVEPADGVQPVLRDGVFTSAGETILGADDKAGIAEIIEAVEILRERQIPHGPIEVVVTVCEEVGLLGAKHLDLARLRSRRGLALDTSGIDLAIHRAPCANKISFEILGREAHAGIAPEQGISAVQIAARGIERMRLGRIDAETTANIGRISGGQAINIIPRRVQLEGEARSHDPEKLQRQTEHMIACFRDAAAEAACVIDGVPVEPQVSYEIIADYPVMHVPRDSALLRLLEEASAEIGRPLEIRAAGGGSDANIFNGYGIETVILGTGMTNVHTVDESVSVADMAAVAALLVEVLRRA